MNSSSKTNIADAIRMASISMLVPVVDKSPIMKDLLNSSKSEKPAEEWDYFMTAAGCGLVLFSTESYEDEHKEIKDRLIEIDKTFPDAIDDFSKFMNNFDGSDELLPANVGLWVLWNVKKERPSDEEVSEVAPLVGSILLKIITDWRSSNNT